MSVTIEDPGAAPPPSPEEFERFRYRFGTGNWRSFAYVPFTLDELLEVSQSWGHQLRGVELPWLCWNVDADWCLVQQKLVALAGWTPVVGWDPRVGPPELIRGAIPIDFNAE